MPQVVTMDNVILNQHILLRLFDAIEDRFEGGLAIHKQLGIIASREMHVDQLLDCQRVTQRRVSEKATIGEVPLLIGAG